MSQNDLAKKKIAIFGSTGSIGESTLNVIRENPDKFEVVSKRDAPY